MIVRLITVHVKLPFLADFELATLENQRHSINEPGVARFDVLRDETTPGTFLLYEMYHSSEAALLHKETAHYQRWRAAVEPMMAKPRSAQDLTLVSPN